MDVLRISLLVGVLSAALAVSGCALFGESHADLEKEAHAGVFVQDHSLVETYYAKEAASIYVGPRVDDPVKLVTVSDGTFREPGIPLSTEVFENLAQADFVARNNERCHTDVLRLRREKDPQENWSLSAEQREGIRDGAFELLQIVTVCDGKS